MLTEILNQFMSLGLADALLVLLGMSVGLLFGFLPGLGAIQAIALLLPITYGMSPLQSMLFLLAIAGSTPFAGSVSAILMNTPGTAVNVATAWDGYPLTQSGHAGVALGASATASGLGAIVGVIILMLILPLGGAIVLAFSYAEFFMLALAGLCLLVIMEQKRIWKGFMSLAIGMVVVSIGYDPVTGAVRLAFGTLYLWDGVKLIPTIIGLFAVSEGFRLLVGNKGDGALTSSKQLERSTYGDVFRGVWAVFRHYALFLRSSVIGVVVGLVPGVGGSVANLLSYSAAVQVGKDKENFGKGDIRGVIAPEASNNAKDGGSLLPTLLFGIPGSAEMAVLLGALMIQGVTPGPRLMLDDPAIVYIIIISLVVSNVLTAVLGIALAPYLSGIPCIRSSVLGTIILILAIIGSYATELSYGDVVVALIFGLVGYFFAEFGFSRVAIVMAVVLGEMMQQNLFRTFDTKGPAAFFTQPISLVLVIITIIVMGLAVREPLRQAKMSWRG